MKPALQREPEDFYAHAEHFLCMLIADATKENPDDGFYLMIDRIPRHFLVRLTLTESRVLHTVARGWHIAMQAHFRDMRAAASAQ